MKKIENAVVLDLFAGSGALGIEVLSRGAHKAVLLKNPKAYQIIKSNLNNLQIPTEKYTVIKNVETSAYLKQQNQIQNLILFLLILHIYQNGTKMPCKK